MKGRMRFRKRTIMKSKERKDIKLPLSKPNFLHAILN